MGGNQPYLAEGPQGLLKTCDVVLKLDDGTEMPVHSQLLARCSPVFLGMLDGGPLSEASASKVVSVPFSECSVKEAQNFLSAIYSFRPFEHIDIDSAFSIARLSHKYGVEDLVKLCDDVLGGAAGIHSDVENFQPYLKEQDEDSFMRIMKSAALCGMPKLLACCEYCIVFDALKKSPEHTALRTRCLSDEQLSRSWSHIAEGSFIAFQRNYDPALHARFDTIPCECKCCQLVRKDPTLGGGVTCQCTGPVRSSKALMLCVPSPKEFLKMAAADNSP